MRLWLKDSERRPDPPVAQTDDRRAMLVGTIAWAVALSVLLLFAGPLIESGGGWVLATCGVGLLLGLLGLLYVARRRR